MASPNNYESTNPQSSQSIPLRDLSRPLGTVAADGDGRRRRRASSASSGGGSEDRFGHGRRSLINRGGVRRYERIAEDSPGPDDRYHPDGFQTVSLSQDSSAQPYVSPTDERSFIPPADFQQAISSVGLSFDGPVSRHAPASNPSGPSHRVDFDSYDPVPYPYMGHGGSSDQDNYFSQTDSNENDTVPLADQRFLQPISGASTSSEQRHERRSTQSVHFADDTTGTGSRLGDDLPNLEDGVGSRRSQGGGLHPGHARSQSHSLAPSGSNSALSRAGSMMRMMSQRVVNLSNEPQIVEQTIRRKSSLHNHARLEAPPSLPAMTEYAHDANATGSDDGVPPEKKTPLFTSRERKAWRAQQPNPLRGKTLGIFAPDNRLRKILCEILIHPATEPIILFLIIIQTVLLAIESSVAKDAQKRWGMLAFDYGILVLFIIYTLELIARIIVSGFIFNPEEYSTLDRSNGLRKALIAKGQDLFMPQRQFSTRKSAQPANLQPSILRSFTGIQPPGDLSGDPSQQQRIRLSRRAFLRHSFNRLDFVAVISYWISFALSISNIESQERIYVFKMLSCLRILRLLAMTSGTTVILRSLKKAAPLLVHVAFLISFFWLLFAIIGVQSFKSSLRRTCVWIDPEGVQNFTLNSAPDDIQFCGGHVDSTGKEQPWIKPEGEAGAVNPKGYLCPQGSLCIEGENPYGGTISFDNVLQSLELVFIIMSSNTFTSLMYYTTDSDYLPAAIFFAAAFVILSLWLVNLLVAVITSSFQVIREESKRSAFTTEELTNPQQEEETPRKTSGLKRVYGKTYWFWILLIAYGLIVQCLRSASMGDRRKRYIDTSEIIVTVILLVEIFLRLGSDWRNFFKSPRNWVDLALAIITSVIQLPPIRNSERAYAAMSVFQVLRIYRIVLAFSVTRELIKTVFGNVVGLLNLIIFVFLLTFLAAIFAVQLFRDQLPLEDPNGDVNPVTFSNIYNSFLGMYQVLSSEDWTSILFLSTKSSAPWNTAWIAASFFIMWFILANFVVLNMFIAVIQESFDVSEDEKRLQQVKAFLQQKQLSGSSQGNLALSTIFRLGRDQKYRDPLDHGPAAMEMLLKEAVVQEFLDDQIQTRPTEQQQPSSPPDASHPGLFASAFSTFKSQVLHDEPNPFYSKLKFTKDHDDLDPTSMAQQVLSASEQRKRAQRQYLQKYPKYNVSLFIFRPSHPIRHLCQRIVGPGRGSSRIEGVDPYKPVWYAFSAFVYAAIVAMVVLACVATPLYQRTYFETHSFSVHNWFIWTDLGFALVFTIEAIIKVIADGFFWTPNAYFRGSWGFIDGIVLITLWVNVVTSFYKDGGVSRIVGAFKALRALRLLNVSDSARETFHAVIILGGWKVISAAFVSMSFLIPFAIYGLNLFNGKLLECNDGDFGHSDLSQCVGEFKNSPYAWEVLAPRTVENPFFDFDNFGDSLFILFQIVSQEGWTSVLWSSMSITGVGKQPEPFASRANGLFFVVFNLLGAVFVLTLFVSVFMRNYTEQTGVAFLTAEQRSWLELRKLLRQISPSKRSANTNSKFRSWCYRIAVKKHGKWARFITIALLFHLVLLVLEFYPEKTWWDRARDLLFLILTLFYIANTVLRLVGLTWSRFRRSSWDLYSVVSVSGTFVTTILSLVRYENRSFSQLHKLFLVSIALLIIPRNNQLDQLFKTAAASLTAIGNLLATWFVLFLVYAIALTQIFGLTKFGSGETGNINFRDVPKALILLFRTSCGEGWNEVMEDFATMVPPYCTVQDDFFQSDCGSAAWARTLFISWNIVSMYIFVSLFVSLIFESFSYVYQRSSGLYAISREEIRRFKQAWATFDPDGTGYISKGAFPRLLGELSGVFEMRVYDGDFTVGRILEDCKVNRRDSELPGVRAVEGVDLNKLSRRLSYLPVQEIRKRRARMNSFYEEVLVSADPERGISFTSCLMILAHYNIITDSKSLRLEEFLRRRARLQRVEEAVRRNVVVGFFDTLYWARRFRARIESRKSARLVSVPQFAVPEIYVEDDESHTRAPEQQSPRPRSDGVSTPMLSPRSAAFARDPRNLPQIDTSGVSASSSRASSPTRSEWSNISPSLSPRHRSLAPLPTPTDRTRDQSEGSVSVQGVIDSLDNSAWGESIRRSFTQRRSGGL
ncbi:hypothetical protein AJ80_03152 [Polytolypa hystricis UAMH7299]|uniref:Calcium-channel protein CCH1 n=1 Tax=Polytolypa hystricis (strain UAMH7299) TaxID=1447883 RepID=A0A2B7YBP1_POLH7|nr:hypothetical protein AJ80_03152 [Polytolypa hystricis UAMH7299]